MKEYSFFRGVIKIPANKEKSKVVGLTLPLEVYEILHTYAKNEVRSDANMALIIFNIGLELYIQQKSQEKK